MARIDPRIVLAVGRKLWRYWKRRREKNMLKFIRKRLTLTALVPVLLPPLSAWIAGQTGMPPEMALDYAWGVLGLAGVYVLGQSWSDVHLIKQGHKEQ